MRYEELQEKSGKIIDNAIEQIGIVLNKVENLDSIIKENKIREFKIEWKVIFSSPVDIDPKSKFEEPEFIEKFVYLLSRMDSQNNIKERIIEISNQTINELKKLWNEKR